MEGFTRSRLTVVDTNGCQSAVTREVEIFDFFNVFIPNSFTPNNDGFNDIWAVYGSDIDPDRFEMTVYNRWGQLVFETTDPEEGWVGQADDEMLARAVVLRSGWHVLPTGWSCTQSRPTRSARSRATSI